MNVSRRFYEAVKLSDYKQYEIAKMAGLHPSTLSRIIRGIDEIKLGDHRVLKVASILNLPPTEVFEEENGPAT